VTNEPDILREPATGFTWTPSAGQLESANVVRLARRLGCDGYGELHRVSIEEPDRFWRAVRADLELPFARDWDAVADDSRGVPWTTWFRGARLNAADACVHRWARERPDGEAVVWQPEDGGREALSWAELADEVTRLAEALAALGIGQGDAVGIFLPMSPRAAVAAHACAHLGAVQVPIFSGFAAPAIAARLADAGAKALLTADGSLRRGSVVPMKEIADDALASAPTVEHVVVWRRLGANVSLLPGRDHDWDELVADAPGTLPPAELESEAPYLLAYTSGTTGQPKGALHVHGGFLLSIAREAAYQALARSGDRLHGGRPRLAGGSHLEARGVRARDDARRLAHARPGADPARRAPLGPLLPARGHDDRRAVEPGAVRLAGRARVRDGPHPDRQHLGRNRGRGLLPVRDPDGADEALLARLPRARARHGRVRRLGPPGPR
jgi:hypothetical protein